MRIAMLVMFLLLAPVLLQAGTLTDDFSDGNIEGWTLSDPWNVGASWQVENGILVGVSTHPKGWDTHLILRDDGTWQDYEAFVRMKIGALYSPQLGGAGLVVRRLSAKQYVQFALMVRDEINGAPNISFFEMDSGQWKDLIKPFAVKASTWYELRLRASANQFRCYVDGREVLVRKFTKFSQGSVGLAINGAEIFFDNFMVIGDEVPNMNLSVESQDKLATTWGRLKAF